MVDKKRVKRSIKQLQRVKTWQLVILLVLAVAVAATFLRLNNIGMVQRRAAVIDADNVDDSQATQNRLYDLQRYVTAHMNADLGKGIYLEASYKRDVQTAYENVANDSEVYRKAQEVCMPKFSYWSQAYVQCTRVELDKYTGINAIKWPNPSGYLHVFVSPVWSFDFAGLSVLICIAILTMIVVRLVSVATLKLLLKHHYKSI